jgi:hypothetical protein
VVNPIQHAQASTAWRAVAAVVLAVMAAVVVVELAAAAVVVALVAAVVVMVAVTAVVVHSAADQQRLNASLAIRPSMVGNGPIIELHLGASQYTGAWSPCPGFGAAHISNELAAEFGPHDFDHARFCHALFFRRSFQTWFHLPKPFESPQRDRRRSRVWKIQAIWACCIGLWFDVDLTEDIIKSTRSPGVAGSSQNSPMKTTFKGNKQSLPSKPCTVCGRDMTWRKAWAENGSSSVLL